MNSSNKNNKTEQKKKNNFSAKKSLIEIEEVGLDPIPVKKNLNMNLNLKKEYIGRKRDLNTKSDKFEKNEKSNKINTTKRNYKFI